MFILKLAVYGRRLQSFQENGSDFSVTLFFLLVFCLAGLEGRGVDFCISVLMCSRLACFEDLCVSNLPLAVEQDETFGQNKCSGAEYAYKKRGSKTRAVCNL